MTAAVLDGFWRRPTYNEVAGLKPDGSPLPEYKATEALTGATPKSRVRPAPKINAAKMPERMPNNWRP